MYWDVHCHLSDLRWGEDLENVLAEAANREIRGFGLAGYDPADWQRQLELITKYPQYSFVPVFGLHPMWVSHASEVELESGLDQLAREAKLARAIGEVGLDARKEYVGGWMNQMEAFRSQLEIAGWLKKPVVLHVVRSHSEALQVLALHRELLVSGFVHAFNSDTATAQRYLDLNLAISIGSAITHSHASDLRKVVRGLPMDQLLLETDSPDQKIKNWPSHLHRPVALWNIAEIVAELKGLSVDEVLRHSAKNFCRIMRI
jgi:TatD DNase family protein